MPNLLAGEEIMPEFIQNRATAQNIAKTALDLLKNPMRRQAIRSKLLEVCASLGTPGASQRAASAILCRMHPPPLRTSLGAELAHVGH
jgi:lipid-A-disaccharide synthase